MGKAADDGDVGEIRYPELIATIEYELLRTIGEDRMVMIAVDGGDIAPSAARLQIVLAHQTLDPLVICDDALVCGALPVRGASHRLRLVADRGPDEPGQQRAPLLVQNFARGVVKSADYVLGVVGAGVGICLELAVRHRDRLRRLHTRDVEFPR